MQEYTLFVFSRRMAINHFCVTTRLAVSHMCRHSTLVFFGSLIFYLEGQNRRDWQEFPWVWVAFSPLREHLGSQVACQVPGHRGTSRFLKRVHWCHTGLLENSGPRTELLLPRATVNISPTIHLNRVVVKDLGKEVLNLSAHYSDQHLKQSAGWSYRLGELKRFQEKRGSAAWSWSWRMKDTQRRRKVCCWDLWRGFKRDYRVWFPGSRDTVSLS